jgi:hypothetical protein
MSKLTIVKEAAEQAMAAESGRTQHLSGRGEKLLAGIIIVTGFQLLDTPTLLDASSSPVKLTCYASLAALTLAALLGFWSLRLKGYAGFPRGEKLWETLKSEDVSEEAAEQSVIQLLLKNREQNAKLNEAKTGSLFWCGWLLFAGIALVIASHVLDALANMSS